MGLFVTSTHTWLFVLRGELLLVSDAQTSAATEVCIRMLRDSQLSMSSFLPHNKLGSRLIGL